MNLGAKLVVNVVFVLMSFPPRNTSQIHISEQYKWFLYEKRCLFQRVSPECDCFFLAGQVEDPSMPNDEGITALHNAVCAGHTEIVKFLVQFGVNVNAADSDGWWGSHLVPPYGCSPLESGLGSCCRSLRLSLVFLLWSWQWVFFPKQSKSSSLWDIIWDCADGKLKQYSLYEKTIVGVDTVVRKLLCFFEILKTAYNEPYAEIPNTLCEITYNLPVLWAVSSPANSSQFFVQ